MCVTMCVCTYVCTYARITYVCMYVHMYACTYAYTNEHTVHVYNIQYYARMYCICVTLIHVNECTYICTYNSSFIF